MSQSKGPAASGSSEQPDGFDESVGIDGSGDATSDSFEDAAALLLDAYPTPAVPSRLSDRLNDQIGMRWGTALQGASSGGGSGRNLSGSLARAGKSVLRSWPARIAIAAGVLLLVSISLSPASYAWANVLAAIKQHGLIQMRGASVDDVAHDVLDLSSVGVIGEDGKQLAWTDQQAALVAFLMREPLTIETLRRYEGVSVVQQDWSKVDRQGIEQVDLSVKFETKDQDQFTLTLRLDPRSKLPQRVSCDRPSVESVALAFPKMNTGQSSTNRSIAKATSNVSDAEDPIGPIGDVAVVDTVRDSGTKPNRDVADSNELTSDPHGSLPVGATIEWSPVRVVSRQEDEAVEHVNLLLKELWQRKGVRPVGRATDLALLRRAHLDLAGRIPTVTEVRAFLKDDRDGDVRYRDMIERLLQSPDHPSQLAAVWRSFLIPESVDLDAFGGREAFEKWLTDRFESGDPYDKIVRELLLAEGRLTQSGPLLFYASLKLDADQLAARTSRAFLGMRLECAQCHDHFFEPWSQEDFWSFAAFFAQISRPKGDLLAASTVMRVSDVRRGEVMLPDTEEIVEPKFLGDESSKSEAEKIDDGQRRKKLADWLTGRENPYFARATVNRVWAQLFGRGIVDPVDDFGINNDPVSPELMDALASYFIDSDFDLQALIRVITLSDAYQLSSSSDPRVSGALGQAMLDDSAETRLETFAQMNVKTLTAEQLYDCIAVATLLDSQGANGASDALSRFGNSQREQFLQTFAGPQGNLSEYAGGIPQALTLMNGALSNIATRESTSGQIRSLEAPFFSDAQRVEILFLATLSRPPTDSEIKLVGDFIPADGSPSEKRQGLADLLWALVNSSEFTLNH